MLREARDTLFCADLLWDQVREVPRSGRSGRSHGKCSW